MSRRQALALREHDCICTSLRQGNTLRVVASKYNVTPGAISQYLSRHPEYITARRLGAELVISKLLNLNVAHAPKLLKWATLSYVRHFGYTPFAIEHGLVGPKLSTLAKRKTNVDKRVDK